MAVAYGSIKVDFSKIIMNSEFGAEISLGHQIQQGKPNGELEQYKVFHKTGGNTTIRPVDTVGELKKDRNPIYTNGIVDQAEISPSVINGTTNQAYLSPDDQKLMHEDVQTATINHVKATGEAKQPWMSQAGYSDGIEDTYDDWLWASARSQEVASGLVRQNNNFQENGMYRLASTIAGGVLNNLKNTAQGIYNMTGRGLGQGQNAMQPTAEAMLNGDDMMFKKIVKYPMDMSSNMDHMFFQCYAYQAPYQEAFKGSTGSDLYRPGKQRSGGLAFGASRMSPYKKKLGAGIKLPMPGSMLDANAREWGEENMNLAAIGAIQQTGKHAISSWLTFDLGGMGKHLRKWSQKIDMSSQSSGRTDMMANKMSQLAAEQGVDVSAEDIMQRSVGVIANSNTELLFAGVGLRSFQFSWTLSPRSPLEAHNVRMIIRAFKQWSAPRKLKKISSGLMDNTQRSGTGKAGGPSYFLGTPNIFRLRYVTAGNKNIMGVNKFKPCACTNVTVNYAPEGQWMAYEGGQPISVTLSLSFQELEPVYNTDYSPDVQNKRKHNPEGTSKDEILGDLMPISLIKQYDTSSSDVGY